MKDTQTRSQGRYDLGFKVGTVVVQEVQVEKYTFLGFMDAVKCAMKEKPVVQRKLPEEKQSQ